MTQEFLDRAEIGASLEEVCRERMSQRVGETGHTVIENTSNAACIQRTSTNSDEERPPCAIANQRRAPIGKPPIECPASRPSNRNDPLSIAFPGDRDEIAGDVGLREPCDLGHPHPGGVQQLEERPIPQRDGIVTVDRFEGCADCPRRQSVRKRPRRPGRVDPDGGVAAQDLSLHTEVEEAANGRDLSRHRRPGVAPRVEIRHPSPHDPPIDRIQPVESQPVAEVQKGREVSPVRVERVLGQATNTEVLAEEEIQLLLRPLWGCGNGCHTPMLRDLCRCTGDRGGIGC